MAMVGNRSTESPYVYDRITTASIRLLKLSRDKAKAIVATLSTVPVSALSAANFTTLSYVWGEKRYHSEKITLNGQLFSVLGSVYPVLEAICDHELGTTEWWWIDSICINQADDDSAREERSSQISLMRRIYRGSKETIVWLGEGSIESDEAMDFLKLLAKSKDKVKSKKTLRLSSNEHLLHQKKWNSVKDLLLKPWWTRVWTLQEFIIAPKLVFYCGSKSISRAVLGDALLTINECRKWKHGLIHENTFLAGWNRRRMLRWYQHSSNKISLVALMAYAGNCRATDGRDRVYSLLGLAQDRSLAGMPDYRSSLETIYTRLVLSFVDLYRSLDIICFTDLFHGNDDPSCDSALPSWVPDWRTNVVPFVVPLMASQSSRSQIGNFRPLVKPSTPPRQILAYAAAGSSTPDIKVSQDFLTLTCNAILIDQIDGLGGTKAGVQEYDQSRSPSNNQASLKAPDPRYLKDRDILLENLVRSLVLDREDRYLNHPAPNQQFRDEFQQLCTAAIENPEATNPRFRNWFHLNKDLLIGGHTIESIASTFVAVKPSTTRKSPGTKFLQRLQDTIGQHEMARRLVITDNGHIGMTTCRVKRGDHVAILLGCSTPVLLRECPSTTSSSIGDYCYWVVGECYLHGFMGGEALEGTYYHANYIKLV